MHNFSTSLWIKKQREFVRRHNEELAKLDQLYRALEDEPVDETNTFKRLEMLRTWFDRNPSEGVFPTYEIMKDILRDHAYYVRELDEDKVSFVCGIFELELVPELQCLYVTNTRNTEKIEKPTPISFKVRGDNSVVEQLEKREISLMKAAKKLADNQSNPCGDESLVIKPLMMLFSLIFTKKIDNIKKTYLERKADYDKEMEKHKAEVDERNRKLYDDYLEMNRSKLYHTLRRFQHSTNYFVVLHNLVEPGDRYTGIEHLDLFMEKFEYLEEGKE